jgi:hypothetical protein
MFNNRPIIKFTAKLLLCTLTIQLVSPTISFALTSGPSQPEVQSFEPVGTTDMVDMFSGDFVYNIPLLDVEGYPINISYHGGVDMEQEASWVGLGWNINPGVINRTVRGLPDDLNGEIIDKKINIKPETNVRVGVGAGAELFGVGKPLLNLSFDLGLAVNVSNYRGVSADITLASGVNFMGMASVGVNMGVGSQNGADVDMNAGIRFNTSQIINADIGAGVGVTVGTGYNSRSGLKDMNFGFSVSVNHSSGAGAKFGTSAVVPIGVKNVVPVVTNSSDMKMMRGQLKLGGELYWCYGHAYVEGMVSKLTYDKDGSRKGYGYLYAHNADDASILDFTRDRDGMFNENMSFLPLGNMTYDIYSVSGQGTGGSFRPFRNDFGSVYDPVTSSESTQNSATIEAGFGNLFTLGGDLTLSETNIESRPWDEYKRPFTKKEAGSLYENTYFKQAGELTQSNEGLLQAIQGLEPLDGKESVGIPLIKPNAEKVRDARGNLMYYFTAAEASKAGVASSGSKILNYTSTNGFQNGSNGVSTEIDRMSNGRTEFQISEMVQVQTDGRRYIYGIPAMNVQQKEVTMAVSGSPNPQGLVNYFASDDSESNGSGRDNFYSKTSTPAFAHSYLLTSVLSTDYVDIKGDGVTDDDFGSFTKFNYSLKDASYGWKAPYGDKVAQYNAGFKSDSKDNKANYVSGTREQWILHSVESKNFVAEFYTSLRLDGRGVDTAADLSYKLDSIKLYNKHDRFTNGINAIPVKTVMLQYDYSLCSGVSNNINVIKTNGAPANEKGKLTLKKIYVKYGNSERSMISPYQFEYGNNYNYDFGNRNRWGGYKPNNTNAPNYDYPYINQNDANLDQYASAWSLNNIILPSGGNIQLEYESDDYAYVMDRPAMEMFTIAGVGASPDFSTGNQLYQDKNNPKLYLYFNRRLSMENPNLSFKNNYLGNTNLLYYNVETKLVNNSYEPVKGYATVESIGACSDGVHGYVKLAPVSITGGGASLNHISYTAINFGRYYLPHIMFPGSDPDESGLMNVLAGIEYAFTELVSIAKNPVKRMTEEGKAKEIKPNSSFIRLNSPGMKKKGGGQRVKKIEFKDNWSTLAGGNTQSNSYGKVYDYTTQDQGNYGTISSGVASYEPSIGGDENPFREPVDYVIQSGGSFPPHEPVGTYQEMPIGESLYPGATVGYSRVTVKSIHQQEGRSSQGVDIYDFYTAKDFPIQVKVNTQKPLSVTESYSFTKQTRIYEGSQGYTLIFNDMHGKPKRTEHRILKPGTTQSELVSYQQYNYFTSGNKISNDVPIIEYDGTAGKMKKSTKMVGLEGDITIDTRYKNEETESETFYVNLNVSLAGFIPLPIPFGYYYTFNFKNKFSSVVATKVIQQYGILKSVQSAQEGALTTVTNEAFDPVTGQALITSVNNEYQDKEFSVTYPAYWGYESMGPSYQNVGFEDAYSTLEINDYSLKIPNASSNNYKVGDELMVSYNQGGVTKENILWVTNMYQHDSINRDIIKCVYGMKIGEWTYRDRWASSGGITNVAAKKFEIIDTNWVDASQYQFNYTSLINSNSYSVRAYSDCGNIVLIAKPRYKYSFPESGAVSNVKIKVIRSGAKNQLNESLQQYTGMSEPFDGNNFLKDKFEELISITAKTYSDTLTAILPKFDTLQNPVYFDSINSYVNGTKQIKRVAKEYAYIKNRDYNVNSAGRSSGLFSAKSLWLTNNHANQCFIDTGYCMQYHGIDGNSWHSNDTAYSIQEMVVMAYIKAIPAAFIGDFRYVNPQPQSDPNWVVARSVTKYSPWGYELENKDALGNYTAAVYGYNHQLPVALAQNAQQPEIFADGFEDYVLLQPTQNLVYFNASPISNYFSLMDIVNNTLYKKYDINNGPGMKLTSAAAHTGKYSLLATTDVTLNLGAQANFILNMQPRYLPFTLKGGKKYIVSYWIKPVGSAAIVNYQIPNSPMNMQAKSRIIEGWQQVEGVIDVAANASSYNLTLPANTYIDDIRIYPLDANMKSFVYHPVNQKLVATLDENNYATYYEYDQEGNLVRTKKETDKGIITIMESRSANVKAKTN